MKIYLETYGCTANKSDESLILGVLKKEHHEIVNNIKEADVLILLTCTVIGTTEQRMLSRLRVFKKTNKKIVVAGCMPSVQPDLVKSIAPDALLLTPQNVHHIKDIITNKKTDLQKLDKNQTQKYFTDVIAPISIAEGCLLSCSYCITHFARGKLKSYPLESILLDVHSALNQGCREIQLTAQDTASYGFDINSNLGVLLQETCKINGDFRVRVGMMNPSEAQKILPEILSAYDNQKIYKFVHLPVQSGDDDILKKMNRGYTVNQFVDILTCFREKYPDITVSTDVIVGFPTETDEQFKKTVQLIEKVRPDIVNITRFSARPLTKAKNMKGRIPTEKVKQRSKFLTDLCKKISNEKNREHIGKTYNVLVTERGKNQTFTGRTDNYKQVVLKEKVGIGDFVKVKIIDSAGTYLLGKLI
ncbi:MAG: tRNA (N(6)-L-threonylcarbamoyladenosine(37)-C(2))-methylthiotransferase [Candidatus Thermoplasmatota archaeon]|jgi:MiaB-like tRNA modifying enzyme|nr:tRNA (N(6)-L-threonylcarbamoyladenosine(37)-C(2))-methylthiotransferase [Candidatus Thermoplasmatota archaeon]